MALPLEQKIMAEIGLGNHYNWYNGSGSCGFIRVKAVEQLPEAIQRHADAGEEIVPPEPSLMELVTRIAGSPYVNDSNLTAVWQACSYIIAQHIGAKAMEEDKRNERFEQLIEYLEEKYLSSAPTMNAWR